MKAAWRALRFIVLVFALFALKSTDAVMTVVALAMLLDIQADRAANKVSSYLFAYREMAEKGLHVNND